MRALIFGGGGQVGRALVGTAGRRREVIAKTHAEVDISDAAQVERAFSDARPDWVINAGAYTAVDLAEDEPERAAAINDRAVGIVAAQASRASCRMLHLSTDFVFDGAASRAYRPDDAPNPLSVYGATKLAGEKQLLSAGCAGIVLRTAWVYAESGKNFVLTMLRLMRAQEKIRVVGDQIGTPTWAVGLSRTIWALIDGSPPPGIYHWTDRGVASWYDFAVAIQDEALARGLVPRAIEIVPIASSEYPGRARRPAFSVLDSSKTLEAVPTTAVHWRENLRAMLDELRTP